MVIASETEINDFLFKFKFFAQIIGQFSFVSRHKNLQSLADLGITQTEALNTILQLTYRNYSSGPEPDRDFDNRKVWKFGYLLVGDEIYIKLADDLSHNIAKCISFHKADFTITYPYRGGD